MGVSALDLCTVQDVHNYVGLSNTQTNDDVLIQTLITAWGFEFLNRTGCGPQDGSYGSSPFNSVSSYDEFYDGRNTNRVFVHNRPIVNVSAVIVNGISVPASSGPSVQGYVVDGQRKSIAMRGGIYGNYPYQTGWQSGPFHYFAQAAPGFPKGIQNVEIQYSAGYAATPGDINECAFKVVAQNYRRKDWIDQQSRAMGGGGGSIRYRDWAIPPECCSVVDRYTRTL